MRKSKRFMHTVNRTIAFVWAKCLTLTYLVQYYRMIRRNNHHLLPANKEGVRAYKSYWKPLGHPFAVYYKLFSNYIGNDYRIVPEDIAHNIIEAVLNPVKYRGYYEDKNNFDIILRDIPQAMPRTFFRRIDGYYCDENYKHITDINSNFLSHIDPDCQSFVAKASVDTSSGLGVHFYQRNGGGRFCNIETDAEMTLEELNQRLGKNFIIQEMVAQHPFMAQFNSSSVNTLRILIYKSVKDNQAHFANCVLRIGASGAHCDNAHQGGAVVGVQKDGTLNMFATNQYGDKFDTFNGIDFSKGIFPIPNWDEVKRFCIEVGNKILHHRCINLDVMIDKDGHPRLIEYNIRAMSVWIYQFNTWPIFGEFTDEVVNYCYQHKGETSSEYLLI